VTLPGRTLLYCVFALAVPGCEAGPSAFDRRPPVVVHPEDTADVSALPAVPEAVEVEAPEALPPRALLARAGSGQEAALDLAPDSVVVPAFERGEGAPRFRRPERVRGLYLNAWAAGSRRRVDELLELARRTEINTFVIDVKDATGYVSHRTAVPMARDIGATGEIRIRDLPGLLARLFEEGIYPIARIVVIKDPLLAAAYPGLAAQDTAGGVFVDAKGIVWLNPYDQRVWDYHVAIAREVSSFGFPEIQWDYVRFPDITESEKARVVYPGAGDKSKAAAIAEFLRYSRAALSEVGVWVTADVFGVTTSVSRDVGIGQIWDSLIGEVDTALPMVYPSHYWEGSFGFEKPNAYPYEVVRRAVGDARRRSAVIEGAGTTRPWLQDFTLGPPRYEAPEVRAQIQAVYDAGGEEWILWNPGASYTPDALEPVGGFASEPEIRVGGQIVPVSRRFVVLDSIAGAQAADSTGAPPGKDSDAPDRATPAPAPRDTVRRDTTAAGRARLPGG